MMQFMTQDKSNPSFIENKELLRDWVMENDIRVGDWISIKRLPTQDEKDRLYTYCRWTNDQNDAVTTAMRTGLLKRVSAVNNWGIKLDGWGKTYPYFIFDPHCGYPMVSRETIRYVQRVRRDSPIARAELLELANMLGFMARAGGEHGRT
jgi:hypothetical protein